MKLFPVIFFLSAAALQAEPSSVLAKVGEVEIRSEEIREMIAGLSTEQQAALAGNPATLGEYVRALIVQRLVLKKALAERWDQEPSVISELVRAREAALSESFLEKVSANDPSYPSQAELASAYESAKSKLLVPRSFHLAQIFIESDKDKLDATVAQLKAKDANFAAIASSKSEEATSAGKGGEIGWLTEEQIQPAIREKLPKLALGSISEPIKLKDGWHILKVLDIREAHTPPLDQIRGELTTRLRAERAQLTRQEYLAQLLKENPVAINEIELNQISKKP
jgi:parvulin-like peptidyl-prolyl isomerase